jgi:hypothetical protein
LRLPVKRLEAFLRELDAEGWSFQPNDNPAADDEFAIAGMNLRDSHQDFVAGGKVKVTFFTLDAGNQKLLAKPGDVSTRNGPRVASTAEIFAMKALVASSRSKSRDWLDLYVLMTAHGFTLMDFAEVYRKAGASGALDTALNRLTSGRTDADDPGFHALMPSPPSLPEITAFFTRQRDDWERKLARERFRPGGE